MLGILNDPHRRHLLLALLVAVGLGAYLVGSVEAIYDFDLAMLLALVGGFPIYFGALNALVRGKLSAELAVSLAAFAALYLGYRGEYDENMYAVAAEVDQFRGPSRVGGRGIDDRRDEPRRQSAFPPTGRRRRTAAARRPSCRTQPERLYGRAGRPGQAGHRCGGRAGHRATGGGHGDPAASRPGDQTDCDAYRRQRGGGRRGGQTAFDRRRP